MRTETETNKETIQIDNTVYVVESFHTPESCEALGLLNLAAHMRDYKQAKQLYLRHPNGKRNYFAIQSINGGFSPVTSLRRR